MEQPLPLEGLAYRLSFLRLSTRGLKLRLSPYSWLGSGDRSAIIRVYLRPSHRVGFSVLRFREARLA